MFIHHSATQQNLDDPAIPGENWFFYWKSSPTLWREKLQSFYQSSKIIVPLNWGQHAIDSQVYDFGQKRPENDLAQLVEVAESVGKEIIFLLSLGPFPFLVNGGLPHFAISSLALDIQMKALVAVDNNGQLNHLYSFYDPRTYQSFRRFVTVLGQYLNDQNLNVQIIGAINGYCENGQFHNYLEDYGQAFEKGLARYLHMLAQQNDGLDKVLRTKDSELVQKFKYINVVSELYLNCAKEILDHYWDGPLRFSFLGGGPKDILARGLDGWDHQGRYFDPLLQSVTLEVVPSSVLLDHNIKSGILQALLMDVAEKTFIRQIKKVDLFEEESVTELVPLIFFEIHRNPFHRMNGVDVWEELNLSSFLDKNYKWTYCVVEKIAKKSISDHFNENILFVSGHELNENDFHSCLRHFMNGGSLILDKTGLDNQFKKEIETFVATNSLKREELEFHTEITHFELGEGHLILFDGKKLLGTPKSIKNTFWTKIFEFFRLSHLALVADDGVMYHWKTRAPSMNELNFEEVRRVSLYNPTSYKRKVKLAGNKNFAFLKYVDEMQVEVKSSPEGIEVCMYPGGNVALDFGFFEDEND